MSRTARLFDLLQLLREYRYPVSGQTLAERLNVSLRTVYRDICELKAQGAAIDGEPGLGFVLRPGFLLPPLMLTEEEIEALVLGASWVANNADSELTEAGKRALAKISAVLPPGVRNAMEISGLLSGSCGIDEASPEERNFLPDIRHAIRRGFKLEIDYSDAAGALSKRTIWPVMLGFFDRHRLLAAWCEMRGAFRHFRTDRIISLRCGGIRYPERRATLVQEWKRVEGIETDFI